MAAVMIGGMVPSFATAAATALFPAAFDEQERRHGRTNWLLGASFISEGALPFVPGAPRAVKLACMTGGALAGGLSMLAGCSLPAPCGGLFLFPLGQNVGGGLAALAAGSLLGGVLFGLMRGRKMRLSVSNRYEN